MAFSLAIEVIVFHYGVTTLSLWCHDADTIVNTLFGNLYLSTEGKTSTDDRVRKR